MSPLPPGHKGSHSKSLALCGLRERPLEFIWRWPINSETLSISDPSEIRSSSSIIRTWFRSPGFSTANLCVRGVVCNALRVFDGESILVTEGDLWRQQRRLLQGGFRPDGFVFTPTRQRCTRARCSTLAIPRRDPVGGEIAARCVKALFRIVLGTEPPPDLTDSIRSFSICAVETGKAVAAEHRRPRAPRQGVTGL